MARQRTEKEIAQDLARADSYVPRDRMVRCLGCNQLKPGWPAEIRAMKWRNYGACAECRAIARRHPEYRRRKEAY